jgi:hypothetical protein
MHVNAHVARRNTTAANVIVAEAENSRELQRYFEHAGSEADLIDDGLEEITFGEFLVLEHVLDRFQLFRALQLQDRLPGVRLGECAAALGYAPISAIERLYERFARLADM